MAADLVNLVKDMRAMQRRWFKGDKSSEVLRESQRLERAVDKALEEATDGQGSLFGPDPEPVPERPAGPLPEIVITRHRTGFLARAGWDETVQGEGGTSAEAVGKLAMMFPAWLGLRIVMVAPAPEPAGTEGGAR